MGYRNNPRLATQLSEELNFLQKRLEEAGEMDVPVWEKYTLTLREAAAYFSIGEKKIRRQYSFYLRKVVDITGGQSDIYDRRRKNI